MKETESLATINNLKYFQHLSDAGRVLLSHGLRYIKHARTTRLLNKGERISGAYVVVNGQLRVYTISPEGHEATLYLINPGETCVLALNCIFSDLLYPAWVECMPRTRVAVIPGATLKTLFESEPEIRSMTIQSFSTIILRLMTELENIHSYKLEQRLANFLVLHATSDGIVRLSQQEIASHMGTGREVIARILRQLASAGHISTGRRRIRVHEPGKLAQLFKSGSA